MTTLVLVRGLPGSGKTTLATLLACVVLAADDWFERSGRYVFDPAQLGEAHADCQDRTRQYLSDGINVVAVTNTFSTRWELEPYLAMAAEHGARVNVIDLFDAGLSIDELYIRGLHGVPIEGIAAMRDRWEHDWRNGDPRPPWERG